MAALVAVRARDSAVAGSCWNPFFLLLLPSVADEGCNPCSSRAVRGRLGDLLYNPTIARERWSVRGSAKPPLSQDFDRCTCGAAERFAQNTKKGP